MRPDPYKIYVGVPCPEIIIDQVRVATEPLAQFDSQGRSIRYTDVFVSASGNTPETAINALGEVTKERAGQLIEEWWNNLSPNISLDVRAAVADPDRGIRALSSTFAVHATITHGGTEGWAAYGMLAYTGIVKETDSTLRRRAGS